MLKRDVFSRDEFKQMGKYFVFVHIDVDEQPALAKAWNASALPAIKFITAEQKLIHEFLGYKPLPEFLREMEKAKAMAGR